MLTENAPCVFWGKPLTEAGGDTSTYRADIEWRRRDPYYSTGSAYTAVRRVFECPADGLAKTLAAICAEVIS